MYSIMMSTHVDEAMCAIYVGPFWRWGVFKDSSWAEILGSVGFFSQYKHSGDHSLHL